MKQSPHVISIVRSDEKSLSTMRARRVGKDFSLLSSLEMTYDHLPLDHHRLPKQ